MKVVSFKTSDEVYDQLKSLNKSFRLIIEPLLVDYLQYLQSKASIPHSIPASEVLPYEDIAIIVDEKIKQRWGDSSEKE